MSHMSDYHRYTGYLPHQCSHDKCKNRVMVRGEYCQKHRYLYTTQTPKEYIKSHDTRVRQLERIVDEPKRFFQRNRRHP